MDIMRMGKNPNYLGSWDLDEEPGKRLTLTIAKIVDEEVVAAGQKEICTVCYFSEAYKPMILNVTNKKRLAKAYHTKDTEKLVGKRITITIERVKAFGEVYDALRFVQQIPVEKADKVINCEECKEEIKPAYGMTAEQLSQYTKKNYGRCLCSKCATAIASNSKEVK